MKKARGAKKAGEPETELRRRARERMKEGTTDVSGGSPGDMKDLVQELEIHQVELEIQNENLRVAQVELAEARDLYTDLYQSAPVGLLTLDLGRKILQANRTAAAMLGVEQDKLPGLRLEKFATEEYSDTLYLAVRDREDALWDLEGLEMEFQRPDGSRFFGRLEMVPRTGNGQGGSELLVALSDDTDRKQAERERDQTLALLEERVKERTRQLAESQERYRQRVESIPHKVWSILPDGAGEYCNQRTLDYLGMSLEEMREWHWKEAIHPEDMERVAVDLSEMLRSGSEGRTEMRIRRGEDGEYRWHAAHAVPVRDAEGGIVRWLGTCTDIHERRKAETLLRQMSRIFRDSAVPILVQDGEGHILDVNAETEAVFGWTVSDLLGKSLKTLLPSEGYEEFERLLDLCRADPSKPRREEMVMLTQSGGTLPVLVTLSILTGDQGDAGTRIAVIAKDVSRLKRAEEALKASERSLREEKKKLEEKNVALREILEQVEREKSIIRQEMAAHIEDSVLPVLDRLAERGENPGLLAVLKSALEDLGSPLGRGPSENAARLTPRERELCRLLKGGLTSKEVAGILNCSHQTIEKHRKNIRRKLGIVGTTANLGSYLNGL